MVRWWAMEATSGAFTPNREVDDMRWSPLTEAERLLTRDADRELLRRFAACLGSAEPGAALEG